MREPKLGAAVGQKGVGKTYQTNLLIQQYIQGNPLKSVEPRRALILDVNDEFEHIKALSLSDVLRFSVHPVIEARRIRPYHKNGMKMSLRDIQDAMFKITQMYRGGLLLLEDLNKYTSDSLPNDLVGSICTNRHTDTDVIMHFQSIGRITPKIWQNLEWLRFHKNIDSVDRHQKKFEDKYEYLKISELIVNQKYYSGDKRYFLYVNTQEGKIAGNITMDAVNNAINEYISINYKKVIAPLVKRETIPGISKKLTTEQAVEHVRQRIITNFIRK